MQSTTCYLVPKLSDEKKSRYNCMSIEWVECYGDTSFLSFLVRWMLQRTLAPSFFFLLLLLSFFLSAFFVFWHNYIWLISPKCHYYCYYYYHYYYYYYYYYWGVRRYVRVWTGMWVCVGGCRWVWAVVLDEFSEFLLENRVPTSADFNTYPIRIFYISTYKHINKYMI